MSFTQEHFELTARVLNSAKANARNSELGTATIGRKLQTIDEIASDFVDAFKLKNSHFKEEKFLEWVG